MLPHAVWADACVDDRVIVAHDDVVDHGGFLDQAAASVIADPVAMGMPVMEVSPRNEGKPAPADPVAVAGVGEPETAAAYVGRQGGPTAIGRVVSPRDPSGRPHGVRPPEPPPPWVREPTPVVEGSPAPTVIRVPVPSEVRVNPSPSMAVGAPAWMQDHHTGLPAVAVTIHVNPGAVGSQRAVEILVGDIGGGRLGRRGCLWGLSGGHMSRFRQGLGSGGRGRWSLFARLKGEAGGTRLRLQRWQLPPKFPQAAVLFDHGPNDVAGNAEVMKVHDLVSAQIEGAGAVSHVRQHNRFGDTGLYQFHQLQGGGRQFEIWGDRTRSTAGRRFRLRRRVDGGVGFIQFGSAR